MRRITLAVMSTISALVVLFSYHTSTNSRAAATPQSPTEPQAQSGTTDTQSGTTKTYTGTSADTQWGPVQVKITVADGKITKSEAVVYPTNNNRDQEINAYAVPQLNQEVVQQQGGDIDAVSGATVTSDGYIQSLQSALDQANL